MDNPIKYHDSVYYVINDNGVFVKDVESRQIYKLYADLKAQKRATYLKSLIDSKKLITFTKKEFNLFTGVRELSSYDIIE